MNPAEARFIYDSISAFLRFVKSREGNRFDGSQKTPPSETDDIPF